MGCFRKKGSKVFLKSKYILDYGQYSNSSVYPADWVKTVFYDNAFSLEEKLLISDKRCWGDGDREFDKPQICLDSNQNINYMISMCNKPEKAFFSNGEAGTYWI